MAAPPRHMISLGAKLKLAVAMTDHVTGEAVAFTSGPSLMVGDSSVLTYVNNGDNSFTVTAAGVGLSDVAIVASADHDGVTHEKTWGPVAVEVVNDRPDNIRINVAMSSVVL